MAERSFVEEVKKLRLGAGEVFSGEGILAGRAKLNQSRLDRAHVVVRDAETVHQRLRLWVADPGNPAIHHALQAASRDRFPHERRLRGEKVAVCTD